MTTKTISRGFLALIATIVALPAIAQEQEVAIFEEILVTAAKREQTLQQVPIAVSVVSADVMNEAQVLEIRDLQFLVPSLRVSQLQTSANATFLIRGFGNGANNAGVEPSVGVFIDGVYRSRSAASLADFPNLERIEVIKGPQSTLFGKNASAGVINVVTAKPSLDSYNGSASVTVGDYSQVIVKGDISGPLSDTVGWSLSGSYNQRDGYFTNLETGGELNELDRYGVRGQLLFAPSDTFEARLIADYDKFEELCCGVAHLADGISVVGIRSPGVGGDMVSNSPFSYTDYRGAEPGALRQCRQRFHHRHTAKRDCVQSHRYDARYLHAGIQAVRIDGTRRLVVGRLLLRRGCRAEKRRIVRRWRPALCRYHDQAARRADRGLHDSGSAQSGGSVANATARSRYVPDPG
jgi:outer membrane receptor protein involved in Fe transport